MANTANDSLHPPFDPHINDLEILLEPNQIRRWRVRSNHLPLQTPPNYAIPAVWTLVVDAINKSRNLVLRSDDVGAVDGVEHMPLLLHLVKSDNDAFRSCVLYSTDNTLRDVIVSSYQNLFQLILIRRRITRRLHSQVFSWGSLSC